MIGNDVIDLTLVNQESNWKRKGFLQKLFTASEQQRILKSANPSQMVWMLWSIKESVYKANLRMDYNRGFYPTKIKVKSIIFRNQKYHSVIVLNNHTFFAKTKTTNLSIHTIAAHSEVGVTNIVLLDNATLYTKNTNGIPFELHSQKEVSVSHHGKYKQIIGFK